MTVTMVAAVRRLISEELNRRFGEGIVFDPIQIDESTDRDGDDYLQVYIVFSGSEDDVEPQKAVGLVSSVRRSLQDKGLPDVSLCYSLIEKSEWDRVAVAAAN